METRLKKTKTLSKSLLKESIHRALINGLINDEILAYIKGLGYARYRNPGDTQEEEAIQEILGLIQRIYGPSAKILSKKERHEYEQLAKDKLGEGLLKNFSDDEGERLAITVPTKIISYLEKQRILFMPLDIRTSTIAEAGRMLRFRSKGQAYEMYALNKHWIGLYFRFDKESTSARRYNLAEPTLIDSTVFTFADANLCNTCIDLFYPGFIHQINSQGRKNYNILYLNIAFKRCWVKGMSLQFWRYVTNFPGTITVTFEDCPDFDETSMPYLAKEADGIRYYFDLEKFAYEFKLGFSNKKFGQYVNDVNSLSANFVLEHLR